VKDNALQICARKVCLRILANLPFMNFLLSVSYAIQAGDEFKLPTDFPSLRIDDLTNNSAYAFTGALGISSSGRDYYGSGAALSRNWVLSAGHNVDFNDDGSPDSWLTIDYHLPSGSSRFLVVQILKRAAK